MLNRAWLALRRVPWWIWLITAIALVLRLVLVPYGLPYEFDPDERLFVDAAWEAVAGGRGDPGWYGVPASTLMDMLAGLFAAYGVGGVLSGAFDSVAAAGDAYRADVSHFFGMARVVTVLSGVAVVLMTYALARKVRVGDFWTAVAALLMAVSFPMIQFSTLVRPDMLMSAFLLATVIASIRALDQPSARAFVVAGVLLGLAATSKYPGALGVVPIVAANAMLVIEQRVTPRRGLLWLGGSALGALLVTAIVAPYLLINFGDTIRAVAQEARSAHLGATGDGVLSNLWRYVTEALPWGLGVPATIAGLAGAIVMLIGRRARVVALAFWGFLVFISILSLWWLRWALPLLPLAAIAAAYLLELGDTALRGWRPGRWLWLPRVAIAILLVWPLVEPTLANVRAIATNDDTRMRAIEWIEANVPDGSTVLIDSYTTQLPTDRYDVRVVQQGELVRWADVHDKLRPDGYFATMAGEWYGTPDELVAAIEAEGVEYIALADLWIDLFRAEAATYPDQLATYEALIEAYPVVERFDGEDAATGWPLAIHRVTSGDAVTGSRVAWP